MNIIESSTVIKNNNRIIVHTLRKSLINGRSQTSANIKEEALSSSDTVVVIALPFRHNFINHATETVNIDQIGHTFTRDKFRSNAKKLIHSYKEY